MFKLIGGVVVCGFALYGLVTYLSRPKREAAIKPGDSRQAGAVDAGAADTSGQTCVGDANAAHATA
ncbi:hypothetical protein LJR125_003704 [Pseudoxanthomonas sp. LjRoot125]|uniref:hypothetical protein n=1 Tax=Pseudoxanthomonas sp. LjRoot125 TaxID=3342258 RepID=UPI003E122332